MVSRTVVIPLLNQNEAWLEQLRSVRLGPDRSNRSGCNRFAENQGIELGSPRGAPERGSQPDRPTESKSWFSL